MTGDEAQGVPGELTPKTASSRPHLVVRAANLVVAPYHRLAIRQTAAHSILSLVVEGRVETAGRGGQGVAEPGWLMVHAPFRSFTEFAADPGLHEVAFLAASPALPDMPEAFPLRDLVRYRDAFGRALAGSSTALGVLVDEAILSSPSLGPPLSSSESRFGAVVLAMREGPVTRGSLADSVGLSPGAFDRAFRTECGEPPMVLARRFKAERIARRLLETDLPLDAMAAEEGFSEASALSRFFVREVGETPAAFRNGAERSVERYIRSFA